MLGLQGQHVPPGVAQAETFHSWKLFMPFMYLDAQEMHREEATSCGSALMRATEACRQV